MSNRPRIATGSVTVHIKRTDGPEYLRYCATFDDYDGAPDSSPWSTLRGHGVTPIAAVVDLFANEGELCDE